MNFRNRIRIQLCAAICAVLALLLTGCGMPNLNPFHYLNPFAYFPGSTSESGGVRGSKSYTVNGKTYYPLKSAQGYRQEGIASWYGKKFHGRKTASGERYNMYAMTAAHKTLPLNTTVRVTSLRTGRAIHVRINDRGPFVGGRIIDLSYTAAKNLGIITTGTGRVRVEAIDTQKRR